MTIRAPIFLLIIVIVIMVIPQVVSAETVYYVAPTERVNGVALSQSEIRGFVIYYSDDISTPLVYSNRIAINDPLARSVDIPDSSVDRMAVMTTIDTDGQESPHSLVKLIKKFVPPLPALPGPPTWPIASPATDRVAPMQ